jgi:CDP-glucose 4,6-dehydratase
MVSLHYLRPYFAGKKVFVTGHTGFKGSWLIQILSLLGAEIKGYALAPESADDLYHQINGDSLCHSSILHDIRDAETLRKEYIRFAPDFIFHLAAQPLVLKGYEEPLYTFDVNGQGTANMLDAIRLYDKPCTCVFITTDKVYENLDGNTAFVEEDKLGGYDPYSASKAVSEIIISSYRSSFFNPTHYAQHQKTIASVRAGNVIGGGDFAANRIIPDIIRSIQKNETIQLRNPHATRPWQHVLEPLGAYLLLATKMVDDPIKFNTAYNIGPEKEDVLSVEELTKIAVQIARQGNIQNIENTQKPHEAATLMLDIHKVKTMLGWHPRLNAKTAIQKTVEWYMDNASADNKCLLQIKEYFLDTIDDAIDS